MKKIFTIALILFASCVWAQIEVRLDRECQVFPIGISAFNGVPISELGVFSRDQSGVWQSVVFQIDERIGDDYFAAPDSIINNRDELVLKLPGLGTQATLFELANGPGDPAFAPYELELADVVSHETTWVYLFRSKNFNFNFPDQIICPTADEVITDYYQLRHAANGGLQDLMLKDHGITGSDVVDRLKIRVAGTGKYGKIDLGHLVVTEDNIIKKSSVIVGGPVRKIRKTSIMLQVNFHGLNVELGPYDLTYEYWLDRLVLGSKNLDVKAGDVKIEYFRYSLDLNSNAKWWHMLSDSVLVTEPDGSLIDALADPNYISDALAVPGYNWWMQRGAGQTILSIVNVPKVDGTSQTLYFNDAPKGTNDPENTGYELNKDTGDGVSYGDTGMRFKGPIIGKMPFEIMPIFFAHEISVAEARMWRDFAANPLRLRLLEMPIVPVELASFSGSVVGDKIALNWSTASELMNWRVAIERRNSTTENWVEIGFVAGHGTTDQSQYYNFVDESPVNGKNCYRLRQIDTNGSFHFLGSLEIDFVAPQIYALAQNYPNPFNAQTAIKYQLPVTSLVTLAVYDMLGREVAVLVNEQQSVGAYTLTWDAQNYSAGVYFLSITVEKFHQIKKMILVK